MIQALLRILLFSGATVGIALAHLAFSYTVPYPAQAANVIFVILSLVLLAREGGGVVWMSFFSHFFIELFAMTPFGVVLAAGTCSMLGVYWLFRYAFTNRSWYTAMVVAGAGILLYRMLFLILLGMGTLFSGAMPPARLVIFQYGWELIFTVLATGALYGCGLLYHRFFHPAPTIRWS